MIERRATATGSVPRLVSVATALPEHVVRQEDAQRFAAGLFADLVAGQERRLLGVFSGAGIESRRSCLPLDAFDRPRGFGETNQLYLEHALRLGAEAASRALAAAELAPADVDHIVFVSSTGIATPSLDARLAHLMGFRADVRRTPLWGLGCAGGAAGVARARDFALAEPSARVLLVAVELCTLTFQQRDRTRQNLVAAALFGDGAAAAVIAGARARRQGANGTRALDLLESRSTLLPDSLDVMGWNVDELGLHVIFSRDIPAIVRDWVRPTLDDFLAGLGLALADVAHLVTHPGGPKVLAAYAESLDLGPGALRHACEVLRAFGNMSSPTCLFVLERVLEAGEIGPGDLALLAALGPGFSSEVTLMRGAET